jgi:Dyp-type peroxidase family
MTALALDDIQGMILGGFNTDFQTMAALTLVDPDRLADALTWLAGLAPTITSVTMVKQTRDAIKDAAVADPPYWLGVAVGKRVVEGLRDLFIRDAAFNGGMVARGPSILGDHSDAATWTLGAINDPVDIFLIIGANDRAAAEAGADQAVANAKASGLRLSYRETGVRLPGEREHFGFRDGISQPKVAGFDPGGVLGAGNFVFGYPAKAGGSPVLPVIDHRSLAPNGSLLVVRRLRQDVTAFHNFCSSEAKRIAGLWPGLTGDHLAALIVGRWPSGAPVRMGVTQDPGGDPPSDEFDFRDDPDASHCPFAAHIRKVNPRAGARDEVDVPRLLRRGLPFGLPEEEDHGLLFLAFQSSIPDQFEKLTRKWMNGAISPNPGNDLLVGRSLSERTMNIIGPAGPIAISDGGKQWIEPTGGAYLFAPGKGALARFGDSPTVSPLYGVQRFIAQNLDRAAAMLSSAIGRH